MNLEYQILIALLLDILLGDPRSLPHPVKLIGRFALMLEPHARKMIAVSREAGIFTAITVIALFGVSAWGLIRLAHFAHSWAADVVSILLLYTCMAVRDLARHSASVLEALETENLALARNRVSLIVGRDTEAMGEEAVVQATVESVAENTSDGVIAPLFYAFLFGPVGAIVYKAINTLDSTFGYKNEQYMDFGWFSAKADDAVNYIPARLTALLIAAAAFFLRMDYRAAVRIRRRDGRRHASPNSGLPEAAMAGALGIQLGGPVRRKGVLDPMPCIGDAANRVERDHIRKANKVMFATTAVAVVAGILITKGIKGWL